MESFKCPNCSKEMSYLTFIKAPTPWHLKCGNCNQKLKLGKFRVISSLVVFLIGMIMGAISIATYEQSYSLTISLLVFVFGFFIIEYGCYFLFKKLGVTLEPKSTI